MLTRRALAKNKKIPSTTSARPTSAMTCPVAPRPVERQAPRARRDHLAGRESRVRGPAATATVGHTAPDPGAVVAVVRGLGVVVTAVAGMVVVVDWGFFPLPGDVS